MSHANEDEYDVAVSDPLTDTRLATDDGDDYDPYYLGGSRKKEKKRGFSGCLAVLVALVVCSAAPTSSAPRASTTSRTTCRRAADYSGPGHGQVLFEVK